MESGFKSVDGRISGSYLATPGGDAGEFILGLQIYSDLKQQHLTRKKVLNLFKDYLTQMKQPMFYLATDDKAVAHLEKQLNTIGLDLINPKKSLQTDILRVIAQAENQGDLHIKLLLQDSQSYSVNKTIVEYFLHSYYYLLWDKDQGYSQKLQLDILAGDHTEMAFIEIKTDMECLRNNRAPLVASQG